MRACVCVYVCVCVNVYVYVRARVCVLYLCLGADDWLHKIVRFVMYIDMGRYDTVRFSCTAVRQTVSRCDSAKDPAVLCAELEGDELQAV